MNPKEPTTQLVKVSGNKYSTQSTTEAMLGEATFFHTPNGEAYGAVATGKRVEVWPIGSAQFDMIIARRFYINTGIFPKKSEIVSIKEQLTWAALLEGPEYPVYVRYAGSQDKIFIDLCNESGDLIKVDQFGRRLEQQGLSPPFFIRYPGMLPIPHPVEGGSIGELANFVNVRNDEDFWLISAWVLGAMNPDGPFPILILLGAQGSSKSTTLKLLRDLIDPSEATLATLPRSDRDLLIAAMRSWLLSLDNVSKLNGAMSDAFCRLSTGAAIRTRKLFSDNQEILLKAKRPVMGNGISNFAYQNDFLDRAISLSLPTITPSDRKPENIIRERWERARPRILGAFYDALAMALRNIHHVKLESLPRMADFARWVTAAEDACPWENGSFITAHENNRIEMVDLALESDPIGEAVLRLMKGSDYYSDTPTKLLEALKEKTPQNIQKLKDWPKAASVLSNRLERLEGFLATKGIGITRERRSDKRLVILTKVKDKPLSTWDRERPFVPRDWPETVMETESDFDLKDVKEPTDPVKEDNSPAEIHEIVVDESGTEATESSNDALIMAGGEAIV